MGIRKIQKGVVGVLNDGTVMVVDEKTECVLKSKGVKAIRVGKIISA